MPAIPSWFLTILIPQMHKSLLKTRIYKEILGSINYYDCKTDFLCSNPTFTEQIPDVHLASLKCLPNGTERHDQNDLNSAGYKAIVLFFLNL